MCTGVCHRSDGCFWLIFTCIFFTFMHCWKKKYVLLFCLLFPVQFNERAHVNSLFPFCIYRSQGFADFNQLNSATNATAASTGQTATSGNASELFDVFASPTTPAANGSVSMNMTATAQVSMSAGVTMPMVGIPYRVRKVWGVLLMGSGEQVG